MKIYPSLISADILNITAVLKKFDVLCDGYHIDIMDGHLVPNLTWGPIFSNAIAKKTNLPLHIHLMVSQPTAIATQLRPREIDCITFHYEALKNTEDIHAAIATIKNMRCQIGMALNPETPAAAVQPFLAQLDTLLIMSVNPGASGQPFIPHVMEKIASLTQLKKTHNPSLALIIDGGVSTHNIAELSRRGIETCAVASAIFSSNNPEDAIKKLYRLSQ